MSIFPFVTDEEDEELEENEELEEFKEAAYDFENNCLLLQGGKPYYVTKNEALKVWIYKALRTKRFIYPAYTHNYGTEVDEVIGLTDENEITDSEIERYITECLMVNPYIQELSNFEFTHSFGSVYCSFDVESVYDKFTYESEVYVE